MSYLQSAFCFELPRSQAIVPVKVASLMESTFLPPLEIEDNAKFSTAFVFRMSVRFSPTR